VRHGEDLPVHIRGGIALWGEHATATPRHVYAVQDGELRGAQRDCGRPLPPEAPEQAEALTPPPRARHRLLRQRLRIDEEDLR